MSGLVSHYGVFQAFENGLSETSEFESIANAVAHAKEDARAVLYAVSFLGQSCLIPRKEYAET